MILTKNQESSKRNKNRMGIRKSRYIELDGTYCYTGKFNIALSLCGVMKVTLYFSKDFLEAAIRESVVTEILWSFGVTVVCFLG